MKKNILCLLALLVCATPLCAAPYVDNNNGTVTDQATSLIWQQSDDATQRDWPNALTYCNTLTLGGSNSWRLPNIKELRSIVDESLISPAIDPIFTGTKASTDSHYWSSTSRTSNTDYAWNIYFENGSAGTDLKKSRVKYVRCVR